MPSKKGIEFSLLLLSYINLLKISSLEAQLDPYLFSDMLLLAACVVNRLEKSSDSSSTIRYNAAATALVGGENI